MSANATAKVTVRLLDQLTAPANIVRNSLRGIRGDMQALSGARLGLTRQIEDLSRKTTQARNSLVALGATTLIAGYGIKKVLKPGTDFESLLLDIGQKADLSDDKMKALGERIKAIGPQVNRSTTEVGKGVDFLLGMGLDLEKALTITPNIGKTATAYRAEVEDLSKASFSVIDNMKVPVTSLGKALDIMAQSGKEGGFELKDMAREFPSLTASAEALGMRGVDGVAKLSAALQIARKGAADGAEAATNTANLMQKVISPETTKKFKKVGIDIRKELKKVQTAGGDPFVMIAEQIMKATKGDLAKLGDFFEDAQVQKFLRPLIAQLDEYKRIRDKAGAAKGVVDADYERRVKTFQAVIDRLSSSLERLGIALGAALIPYLSIFSDKISAAVDGMTQFVASQPGLVAAVAGVTAALFGLAGVVSSVRLLMAGLSLVGIKGIRGLLNYLAPKGGPAAPTPPVAAPKGGPGTSGAPAAPRPGKPGSTPSAAGTPKTPGPSVPSTATPGSIRAQNNARPMTAAELNKAASGTKAHVMSGANGVANMASRLKAGLLGFAVQYIGETVIEGVLDALPQPKMPAGYDPKAEMNMSFLDRLKRLTGAGEGKAVEPVTRPLQPDELERSRRVQDEQKRDPEGFRGRAMQQRDQYADKAAAEPQKAVSDASVGADSRTTGAQAGADVGQGIKDGLAAQQAGIEAAAQAIMNRLKQMFAAGIDVPVRPKLEGAGAALRGIHSDTGID